MYAYLERLYIRFIVSLIIKHSQGLFRSTLRNCVQPLCNLRGCSDPHQPDSCSDRRIQ